jgi:hypothetical protein
MKNTGSQEEIFFTMKVYATTSKGKIRSLKYSIDLHPPFDADKTTIAPYASPIVRSNMPVFNRIFDHVKEVFKFISDPTGYKESSKDAKKFRLQQQKDLAEAIRLSRGAINHITFEENSPPVLTVGASFTTTGNGDMRPPKGTDE